MQLVSFTMNGAVQVGAINKDHVFPLREIDPLLPASMRELLENFDESFPVIQTTLSKTTNPGYRADQLTFVSPLPNPASFRDGYAFRAHVAAARKNRGVPMIAEFDQYPVFYFGNTTNIYGPGDVAFMPDHFVKLDYELEAAIVIGKAGKNILAEDAHNYMAGMMILNDWSARTLQMEEMLLNLGPAKGKDLGCSLGPALVTMDELQPYEVPAKNGHRGKAWQLGMRGYINGALTSEGNLADMDWTFGEIIERASYGVELRPGDIIGSGTVGTGCLLELNGTNGTNQWLKENDVVRFEIDGLGVLENRIRRVDSSYSLLKLKESY